MTSRRILGTGPQTAHSVHAAQADLLHALPGIHLPDLDQLRARGVLGTHPAASRSPRRPLGTGDRTDADPPGSPG